MAKTRSTPSTSHPSPIGNIWRLLNLIVAVLMTSRAYLLVASDPDWWIWVPVYAVGSLVSFGVGVSPTVTGSHAWRYLCALMIVTGCMYVAYTSWLIKDVASLTQISTTGELMEARELLLVTVSVMWCCLNRLYLHRVDSVANVLRLLIFVGVAGLLGWSMSYSACFYESVANTMPHCQTYLNKI